MLLVSGLKTSFVVQWKIPCATKGLDVGHWLDQSRINFMFDLSSINFYPQYCNLLVWFTALHTEVRDLSFNLWQLFWFIDSSCYIEHAPKLSLYLGHCITASFCQKFCKAKYFEKLVKHQFTPHRPGCIYQYSVNHQLPDIKRQLINEIKGMFERKEVDLLRGQTHPKIKETEKREGEKMVKF